MKSNYYKNLIKTVLVNSDSNDWENAVLEWEIEDWEEDEDIETSCLCGKEHIRYLFSIKNINNNNLLEPIGSSCIKKFDRNDFNEKTTIYEKLFKLNHAIEKNEYIELTSELFSKKILKHFYEEDIFNSKFNEYNGEKDYKFMVKMFNKRNEPSKAQDSKIKAIIINQIKPYLKEQLENKNK